MSGEIMFEILKVIVMLAVLVFMRYIVPLVKARIGSENLEMVDKWVHAAVLMVQQVHNAKPGPERKAIVVELIREMLIQKNIDISIEQLDMLIEAAVKTMKMEEAKGETTTMNVTSQISEQSEV